VTSNNPTVAVPIDNTTGAQISTLAIPAGTQDVTFGIQTYTVSSDSTATFRVQIVAPKRLAAVRFQVLRVIPQSDLLRIASMFLSSQDVLGGSVVTGHVTIANPAPAGGVYVDVATNSTRLAPIDTAQVYVPAGALRSSDFNISTSVLKTYDQTV